MRPIRVSFGYGICHHVPAPPRYTPKPGEIVYQIIDGRIIVASPDKPLRVIHHDGSETIMIPGDENKRN